MKDVCVYTLTDAWMCECTYMRMCVDIMMSETIMNLQMNRLKLAGTKVKNMLCACVCVYVIISGCVGWERELFSKS